MCSTSGEQDGKGAKMAIWLHVDTPPELRADKNVTDIEDWSTNRETTAPPPRERKQKGSLEKKSFLLQIFKFITSWSLHGGVNP